MAARRLIPLLDRVLVEKIVAPTKSTGGVLLPESATQKVNEGLVVAVGPGRRTRDGEIVSPSVKEGDTVLLPEYGGNLVKLDHKEFFLYRDEDILGILTKAEKRGSICEDMAGQAETLVSAKRRYLQNRIRQLIMEAATRLQHAMNVPDEEKEPISQQLFSRPYHRLNEKERTEVAEHHRLHCKLDHSACHSHHEGQAHVVGVNGDEVVED